MMLDADVLWKEGNKGDSSQAQVVNIGSNRNNTVYRVGRKIEVRFIRPPSHVS